MVSSPILQLQAITKTFAQTAHPAVCDVTLTLEQGSILALLGPSGCGKTTLLRLIAGFEQPDQGQIELAGRVVANQQSRIMPEHRSIGMVFQDFALFPHLTVAENVAFGLKQTSQKTAAAVRDRTVEVLSLVGLQQKARQYPHELSGGQQQRVALARALAPYPSLMLLDEPLSNLDLQVRLYLRQEVRDILKATGTSGIFVTHDQEEALSIADQVAVMHQGRLEQLGSPEEIYQKPASRFIAEFVTQANFLPTHRRGQVWETEIGCFASDRIYCSCQTNRDFCDEREISGELMIRQEEIQIHPDELGQVIVRDRHFLGREYCYYLQTPSGQTLRVRTPVSTAIPSGAGVTLSVVKSSSLMLLHPESSYVESRNWVRL